MNYQSQYYPNFYQQYQPQPFQNVQYQTPQPTAQTNYLNGKIVDSVDVVRATEVPMGGYGVFLKADMSEVYIKTWNANGTTSITTFVPAPIRGAEASDEGGSREILEKLSSLDGKLSKVIAELCN